MDSANVIIPTTGRHSLGRCVASVLAQTHANVQAYIVCDGSDYQPAVSAALAKFDGARLKLLVLPENVGAGGFYGHRTYAGCSHFVNSKYVLFLDEDNWFEPPHVAALIGAIQKSGLDWAYSLRRIHEADGEFVADDDCESLGFWPGWQGYNLVDTSSYCLKREVAAAVASAWHGGWGQDRVYFAALHRHFPKYGTSGLHTLNYRLGGNPHSVRGEFFLQGNEVMRERHDGHYPWRAAKGGAVSPRMDAVNGTPTAPSQAPLLA